MRRLRHDSFRLAGIQYRRCTRRGEGGTCMQLLDDYYLGSKRPEHCAFGAWQELFWFYRSLTSSPHRCEGRNGTHLLVWLFQYTRIL